MRFFIGIAFLLMNFSKGNCNIEVAVEPTPTFAIIATVTVGSGSSTVGFSPDSSLAYVPNTYESSLSIIDTDTKVVIATVEVGDSPSLVAVPGDGSFVYILSNSDDAVTIIDSTNFGVVATITVPLNFSSFLTPTPGGSLIYVGTFSSESLVVIDNGLKAVVATITIPNLDVSAPIAGETFFYIGSDQGVVVVDNDLKSVIATITIGSFPSSLQISPSESLVSVPNFEGGTDPVVSFIDTGSNLVVATVPVGLQPSIAFFHPVENLAYVSNNFNITVIDTSSFNITATITVLAKGLGPATDPDGTFLYYTNKSAGFLFVVDTEVNTIVATITVEDVPNPNEAKMTPDGAYIYVPYEYGGDFVLILDTKFPVPPEEIVAKGDSLENIFLTQKELFNKITWAASTSADVFIYRLYRDSDATDLIGSVLVGNELSFKDHNREPKTSYSYFIKGEDSEGDVVAEGSLSVTTP